MTRFHDDATFFMPYGDRIPHRLNGKKEIASVMKPLFDEWRRESVDLNIQPKAFTLQMLDKGAVVSFELNPEDHFGRRTVVFQKIEDQWQIIHLHASNYPYKE